MSHGITSILWATTPERPSLPLKRSPFKNKHRITAPGAVRSGVYPGQEKGGS